MQFVGVIAVSGALIVSFCSASHHSTQLLVFIKVPQSAVFHFHVTVAAGCEA